MINTKRGILSAILAILCIVALALGVSFLMPKAEKINADAIVDGSIVEANGKLVLEQTESTTGDISVNESVGVVSFRENSTTTTHSALAQWFSMKMTVPAYTQYTVSYTLMFSVKVAALGSGTAKVQSQIEINRYDNINGALKGSVGALNLNFDTVNQPQKVPYTINNFVFYNDTGAPKDFKAYFKFEFKTVNKPRAAMFSGSFWWDDYVVEAMGLSAPKTNDTLTCNYDGKPHTLNFVYAEEQVSTDLDGNSVLYNSGYKNVNVTVDAVDGNGATTNTYTFVNNGTSATDSEGSGSITATETGTYTVKFSLSTSAINNGIEWDGGGTADKTLVLKINKIDPIVNRIVGMGTWYPSNDIYRDISITTSEGDTAGNIVWDAGQNLSVGTNNYTWTFTPTDTNNYNTKTGTESISVAGIEITGIRVLFNQGSTKFYTSNSIDDLKTRMAVFKVYNDGSEIAVDASDYELDGDISEAGTVTVDVIYTSGATELPAMEDFTGSFNAEITEVNLVSISADFDTTHTVYLSDGLDSLRDYLTVNGMSNDGSAVNGITAYTLSTESGGLSVGTVTVKVTYDNDDSITTTFTVEVESDPVLIELKIPEVNDLTYTGETFEVLSELQNLTSSEVATYLDVSGTVSGKLAGEYTVKFKIKDEYIGSVKWENQTATPARYGLTARLTSAQLSADGTTVELTWKILKAKVAAVWDDENSIWVPVASQLAETTESNFLTQVYTNSDGKEFTNRDNLAGGRTYQVTARINPLYSNNIELDESTQALMESGSETYSYTPVYVPTIWEKIVQFLKANWLWIVIAVAALILLIIIIAVAVKRRKTKEERAEKKAVEKEHREEEKRRKEEERQRREEERRLQKEKLDAERELAKAKQEAELEKIRAQAGMGMAGAGMASMAVQQPPVQQPVPQAQQLQQPQYMPQPVPQYYQMPIPQPMPQYAPMPQQSADGAAIARLEAQINAMQAEQRARYDAEQRAELAALRAEQSVDRGSRNSIELAALREQIRSGYGLPDYSLPHAPQTPAMDMLGALVVAALKNIATADKPATAPTAIPQSVEESTQGGHAQYPSDAVITTTTTVDTTKSKPVMRTREEESGFDVDGFYDNADY